MLVSIKTTFTFVIEGFFSGLGNNFETTRTPSTHSDENEKETRQKNEKKENE
jgi:hypothetical protein